jgi:hypothetical protein
MKKLILTFILATSILSCSSDSGSSNSGNQININGTNYNITDAKAVDNYNFFSTTHAEFNFVLASSAITIEAVPGTSFGFVTDNAKFALNLSIAALGTTFQNGVYQYDENMDFEQPNFNFFDGLTIYIDNNQNGSYFDSGDSVLFATAGTVTVSGTAPNYILAFNVTLSNGQNLNFTYNQGFDYVNNRN